MPLYTYLCDEHLGGCGLSFEKFLNVKNYTPHIRCPQCRKIKSVYRDFITDANTVATTVRKSDTEIKLGHLAHRNTERMSEDEKAELTRKHNAYRYEEPQKELPPGMHRIPKDPTTHKPKVSQKQRRRDPKKRKKQ